MGLTRLRTDGRLEVADTAAANRRYGCRIDEWCILAAGHDGDCCDDREEWPGPDAEYPEPTAVPYQRHSIVEPPIYGAMDEHDPRL